MQDQTAGVEVLKEQTQTRTELLGTLREAPEELFTERDRLTEVLNKMSPTQNMEEVLSMWGSNASDADFDAALHKGADEMFAIDKLIGAFFPMLDKYSEDVVQETEDQRHDVRLVLRWSTYVTFTLFGLGWFLGLIGKVLKLPALGGTDE